MMTILHIDDFVVYDEVRSSGDMNLTWLSRAYEVRQTTGTGLRLTNSTATVPYQRQILANTGTVSGQRSVYLPLGLALVEHNRITIGQKLVDFTPSPNAIGGISLVATGVENHILAFGFSDYRNGFVRYVNANNVVVEDTFILATSLSGTYDTIEWTFEKEVNDASEYRPFTLWVNNRPAYVGNVFCQIGSSGSIAARILGGINTLAAGATSSDGFLNAAGNISIPSYGIADLIVTDGVRQGRVRIISRRPFGDIGPNTMQPSEAVDTHADIVNDTPPSDSRFLTAVSAAAEERFWGQAFPDLSSENVLAVAVRVAGVKNSPDALDLAPTLRLGANDFTAPALATDLSIRFGSSIFEKNPWTNLNWTPLEVNSVQFGVKVA